MLLLDIINCEMNKLHNYGHNTFDLCGKLCTILYEYQSYQILKPELAVNKTINYAKLSLTLPTRTLFSLVPEWLTLRNYTVSND